VWTRERLWLPAPHDLVHALHAVHVVSITQSTAHACKLQVRTSLSCGHAAPPNKGEVLVRERLWYPEPHDLVHVLQGVNALELQSAAQSCVLQDCVSALCGHALPPSAGSVVARERLWLPLPHDTVHVLHAENDS
jgi:hypothetical protein